MRMEWTSDDKVHNGVFCHKCFETIDLSVTAANQTAEYAFFVTCENCGEDGRFTYEEVKPIENFKDALKTVVAQMEARMDKMEGKIDSAHFKSDLAKAILKMIDKQRKSQNPEEKRALR